MGSGVSPHFLSGLVAPGAWWRGIYSNIAVVQPAAFNIVDFNCDDAWISMVCLLEYVVSASAPHTLREVAYCVGVVSVGALATCDDVFCHSRVARANSPHAREVHGVLVTTEIPRSFQVKFLAEVRHSFSK